MDRTILIQGTPPTSSRRACSAASIWASRRYLTPRSTRSCRSPHPSCGHHQRMRRALYPNASASECVRAERGGRGQRDECTSSRAGREAAEGFRRVCAEWVRTPRHGATALPAVARPTESGVVRPCNRGVCVRGSRARRVHVTQHRNSETTGAHNVRRTLPPPPPPDCSPPYLVVGGASALGRATGGSGGFGE